MTRHLIDDFGHATQTAVVDEWGTEHLPLTSVALAAAVPIIEAELRERIARDIEAAVVHMNPWTAWYDTARLTLDQAAAIARGAK